MQIYYWRVLGAFGQCSDFDKASGYFLISDLFVDHFGPNHFTIVLKNFH